MKKKKMLLTHGKWWMSSRIIVCLFHNVFINLTTSLYFPVNLFPWAYIVCEIYFLCINYVWNLFPWHKLCVKFISLAINYAWSLFPWHKLCVKFIFMAYIVCEIYFLGEYHVWMPLFFTLSSPFLHRYVIIEKSCAVVGGKHCDVSL